MKKKNNFEGFDPKEFAIKQIIENDKLKIFLARSKLRLEVLKHLKQKPQIASFLAKEMKKYREVISRIFSDLQKEGLAKCRNPNSPNFRYYEITNKGENIIQYPQK